MSASTPSPFTPNLDAYFSRIGYTGGRAPTLETLRALHLHHVCAIPFENLDVLLDRHLSLELPALEQKLVHARRGGYCYEQNTYFAAVLRALGFRVANLIARVRWQVPLEVGTPRSHMILRIDLDGRSWIADVGFGGVGLTAPIALELDIEQTTPHEPRRLIRRGEYIVHQVRLGSADWQDAFMFTPDEVPAVDYEVANWFSNRHPRSHFQNNLLAARAKPDGRVVILNREVTFRSRDGKAEKQVIPSADALLEILAQHFGLKFPVGTRFGSKADAPWPQ
jgi:N-hydroxyarylamine O-acetyltransferase